MLRKLAKDLIDRTGSSSIQILSRNSAWNLSSGRPFSSSPKASDREEPFEVDDDTPSTSSSSYVIPPPLERKVGPNGVPRYDFLSNEDRHASLTHFTRPELRGPFIYTNWVNAWPLIKRDWSELKKLHGNNMVTVEESENGGDYRDFYAPGWKGEGGPAGRRFEAGQQVSLAQLIDHIHEQEGKTPAELARAKSFYWAQQDMAREGAFLSSLVRAPVPHKPLTNYFRPIVYRVNVWMGPKGTLTPLHYDPYQNLLCQVRGKKEVVLFHPQDSDKLRPFSAHAHPHLRNTSTLDLADPRIMEQFPELRDLAWNHVILKEGEALYIPRGWWHFVRALEGSLSVNFWWNRQLKARARRSS